MYGCFLRVRLIIILATATAAFEKRDRRKFRAVIKRLKDVRELVLDFCLRSLLDDDDDNENVAFVFGSRMVRAKTVAEKKNKKMFRNVRAEGHSRSCPLRGAVVCSPSPNLTNGIEKYSSRVVFANRPITV